ncbi:MAG: ankyrin repeat domain-containing protein [Steroidobacteraceae bacterium]|nr:ankyrin repeat domain-containing protein [Steroidobacteraceae bacterium]
MRMGGKVAAAVAVLLCAAAAGSAAAASADEPRKPDGSTPLMQAAFEGDVAEAKRLIEAGADVTATNIYGVNAMQLAADIGNTELIRLLLKAGADPESPNADGETALHLVARSGNVEAAKLLLNAGAKVDPVEQFGGQTPLMWAVARRHPEMVEFLLSRGANVNARSVVRDYRRVATAESRAAPRDRGGFTPLLYAARHNCGECVEVLLKYKADVNLPDPSFVVPLSIAMMNSNWDIAKRLVEAGADVNQWDINGSSPLHVAIANMNSDDNRNPLDDDKPNKATGRDLIKLLLEHGANPNQQLYHGVDFGSQADRGLTPFLAACRSGDIELVKLLLEHGANPRLATSDGRGPIIMAISGRRGRDNFFGSPPRVNRSAEGEKGSAAGGKRTNPQVELIRLLAKAGADVNLVAKIHLLARTRGGSALHYAVRAGGNREVIQTLLDLGIDINVKDEDGLTALDYAMGRGYVPFLAMPEPPNKPLSDFLRGKGATIELAKTPDWPPQGPPIATAVYDSFIWPVDPVGP